MEKTAYQEELAILEQMQEEIDVLTDEERQVIVHCTYKNIYEYGFIRIWKSTFLIDKDSSHKSYLLHAFNITIFPNWKMLKEGETLVFTLIFSALPKNCSRFDLIEDIPQVGGFEVLNIERNSTDIYHLTIE